MDYFGRKLHTKGRHLFWENDQPFFFLADTLWYGLTSRTDIDSFTKIIKKRKEQGFTAIQLVVGTPPELSVFDTNARSTNGEFVFYNNNLLNPRYFEDIQKKIEIVVQHKLVPVIYGSWGNYIDITGAQSMKDLWTYIIKTCDSYPVIYCICGEADIFPPPKVMKTPWFQEISQKIKGVGRVYRKLNSLYQQRNYQKRITDWTEVAEYVSKINKEMHPITIHISSARLASDVFVSNEWLSIDSFQSGHSPEGLTTMTTLFSEAERKNKPYVNLEPLYEGIMNQHDTRLQQCAFWKSIKAGAIGHTYGAHGLWQMAKDDNFMSHWGNSTWEKALEYTGALSLGNAKNFLQSKNLDWTNATDCNEIEIQYSKIPQYPEIKITFGKTSIVYIPDPTACMEIMYNEKATVTILEPETYSELKTSATKEDINNHLTKCKDILLMFEPS